MVELSARAKRYLARLENERPPTPLDEEQIAREALSRLSANLLNSGFTFAELAGKSGVDYQELYRLLRRWGAYKPRRSHQGISREQERQIVRLLLDTNMSRRAIAREVGVSKGSVDIRSRRLRRRAESEATEEVAFARKPHRCPVHGDVAYTPCPICQAKKRSNRES